LVLRYASGVSSIDVCDPLTQRNVAMLQGKGLLNPAEPRDVEAEPGDQPPVTVQRYRQTTERSSF
jgi:hypothetical protein